MPYAGQLLRPRIVAVRAASTANVTVSSAPATLDGVTLVASADRVLLKDQTTVAENGVYDFNGSTIALTRSADAGQGQIADGFTAQVAEGTTNAETVWKVSTSNPIVVGTTSLQLVRIFPAYAHGRRNYWAVGGDTVSSLGETCDRAAATGTLTLATAATHLCVGGIIIPAGRALTNVNFHYTTAAATITIFYVSIIRASDRNVLKTSANATGAWAAAPATKTVALSSTLTVDSDTPVYVGIALAATTAAIIDALPSRAAAGNYARAPILVGNTTTPTTTPITGTAGALTATLGVPYVWLT